jgi:NADH-quinone oxidoreductase subunit D
MLEDRQLADLPIVIAAIDPCFSCTDRLIGVKEKGLKRRSMKWEELREYSIHWYQHKGIDFTDLNKRFQRRMK